ncbi:MAG: hypothetical protein HQL46_08475 [Gammaproteobacteria bacterium]|nr:hypothetical protein [Gammaproteobacteria bacterium]
MSYFNSGSIKRKKRSNGQAMVEFAIAATFFLVPLFLIIPLLAKYIEIQQYSVQAARYEAWEYTAWFGSVDDMSKTFNSGGDTIAGLESPTKTAAEVQIESRQRFFSDTKSVFKNTDKTLGWQKSSANPFLKDNEGNDIYLNKSEGSFNYNSPTPDLTSKLVPGDKGVATLLIGIVAAGPTFISNLLSVFADLPEFDIMIIGNESLLGAAPLGYHKSNINVSVAEAPKYGNMNSEDYLFLQKLNLQFNAQAAVLTNGWNAGGQIHAKRQSEGLVPTRILREPFDFVVDILSYIPFIPVSELNSLEWGYTDSEAIPPEYIKDGGETSCDDKGYCSY